VTKPAARIAKRLPGIDAPDIPTRHRYPEMVPVIQLEALADFLDALDGAIKDEGYAATAKPADPLYEATTTTTAPPDAPTSTTSTTTAPSDPMAALDARSAKKGR